MSEKLFVCLQVELPFQLGPPDGRYVLRGRAGGEPEHVLVLRTIAGRRPGRRRRLRRRSARRIRAGRPPEPAEVSVAQATVIDAIAISAEHQARAWLHDLDPGRDLAPALDVLDRFRFAHRIATAEPSVHGIDRADAIAIRAGFGTGAQVADGRLAEARELPTLEPRGPGPLTRLVPVPGRRARALRPQERFAALLGARDHPLLCEELALRAREDLDLGRLALAAVELDSAFAAAIGEPDQTAGELGPAGLRPRRLEELRSLQPGVAAAAQNALDRGAGAGRAAAGALGTPDSGGPADDPDLQAVRRGLVRLEEALRERAAARAAVS